MPEKCTVMDVETIPDEKVCLDKKGFEFPLPIFHKIVSLSYAVLGNSFDLQEIRVLGLNEMTEKELLIEFGKVMNTDTMLVTFCGRRLDLPVILYRSMKYGIPCPWYFKKEFDKRYSITGHVDIQDHMMLFGAAEKLKLEHASTALGLPGKMDVKGSDVQELWARNRFKTIGTYNVCDVIETTVVFLRWAHLRGLASTKEVNEALDSISAYPAAHYIEGAPISHQSVLDGIKLIVSNCDWNSLKV